MTYLTTVTVADLIIGFAAIAAYVGIMIHLGIITVGNRRAKAATIEAIRDEDDDVETTKFDPTVFATFTGVFFAARLEEAFFAEADRIEDARLRAAEGA